MPIADKFQKLDNNSYQLSIKLDELYNALEKNLYIVAALNNERDLFELVMNIKRINTQYAEIIEKYIVYSASTHNLDAFKECIIYNFNLKGQLLRDYCMSLSLSDEFIATCYAILKKEMTLFHYVKNIDLMINSGKNINFSFILYRIESFFSHFAKETRENTMHTKEKEMFFKLVNSNIGFYEFFKYKFLTYIEFNIYKKIFPNSVFLNSKVEFTIDITPGLLMKTTLILNEVIEYFVKEAREIFKNDASNLVKEIYAIRDNIFDSLNLFECKLQEIRKLTKLMMDIDDTIGKVQSVNDFEVIVRHVEQDFPNIRKEEFISYVVNKFGRYLERNKDSDFLAKMRYYKFIKDYPDYDPKFFFPKNFIFDLKWQVVHGHDFEKLQQISLYCDQRKKQFNIEDL